MAGLPRYPSQGYWHNRGVLKGNLHVMVTFGSLIPRPFWGGGGERAWYTPTSHVPVCTQNLCTSYVSVGKTNLQLRVHVHVCHLFIHVSYSCLANKNLRQNAKW